MEISDCFEDFFFSLGSFLCLEQFLSLNITTNTLTGEASCPRDTLLQSRSNR